MAADKYTGVQKAAIVLTTLGEQFSAEIFKQLDEEEIRQVGLAMQQPQPRWTRTGR